MTVVTEGGIVNIYGDVRTHENYISVKTEISALAENMDELTVAFHKSNMITSPLIGFIVRVCNKDKKTLHLKTDSDFLYNTLESLEINQLADVERVAL